MNKLLLVSAILTVGLLSSVTLAAAPAMNTELATHEPEKADEQPWDEFEFPEPIPAPQVDCELVVPKCDSMY